MDESFFLRAKRLLDRQPVAPTHRELLDHVAAQRAASPTARATAQAPTQLDPENQSDSLAALILGESGWRAAGRVQRGCFNRAAAARRVNIV